MNSMGAGEGAEPRGFLQIWKCFHNINEANGILL